MNIPGIRFPHILYITFLLFSISYGYAQNLLTLPTHIRAENEKLSQVMARLSQQGNFYFSYQSNFIVSDSLVSVHANGEPLTQVLDQLFQGNIAYRNDGKYIILRPAPNRLSVFPEQNPTTDKQLIVTGHVVDDRTGKSIPNASVYEKTLLLSTLTDQNGNFRLKIKTHEPVCEITISKALYRDTTLLLLREAEVDSKQQGKQGGYWHDGDPNRVERTFLGRLFSPTRQRLQSLNLGGFFAYNPVQLSLTPGLSSRGMFSSQVVSNFSYNILGGYTAGVRGLELAGLFNINKTSMRYVQAAGLFNIVGGAVHGIQLAGVHNHVLDSVSGLQAAGIFNHAKDQVSGVQIAGIFNLAEKNTSGAQVAGLLNVTRGRHAGVQFGIMNVAHQLKGMQIGLINKTDTAGGIALGLVNLMPGGYHRLVISYTDFRHSLISFQSGNKYLYSILSAGMNFTTSGDKFTYAAGAGVGHYEALGPHMGLAAEYTGLNLFSKNGKDAGNLQRFALNLEVVLGRQIRLFAGPAYNLYTKSNTGIPDTGIKKIGWAAGISLF